jgi:VWFA-related protein
LFWLVVAAASLIAQQPPAAPSPPGGQDPPPDTSQQPPPRFTTEANFVRVDVYPTKDGVPVQDLRLEDFEVLENGDRQAIQAFEHVVISPAGPQTMRMEANSVRGGEQMAANPRNRVFVFFLDYPHVDVAGSYYIKEPLIGLMDRILGPDDLVAVMTPEMSAAQVTFGRKTEVIADMLRDRWHWGQRHSIMPMDQREVDYERCYPDPGQRGLLQELKARRRERMTLDALHDLVRYLGGVREERKAIVTVTDGWLLYRSNQSLMRVRETDSPPGLDPVGVDDQGKLRVGGGRYREGDPAPQTVCERERMHLAFMDNHQHFLDLMDLANRHNASFYPVDPRGLPAMDYPMGPNPPPPITIDAAHLKRRIENSIVLATNTDGLAVVNSNNLDKGLRRIADDLTSYYLLGYYSSNTRLDGKYREIKVRVKRPGIDVRARRGYRAATAEEVKSSREAAAAPVPEAARTTDAALATLDRLRADRQFSIRAVAGRDSASGRVTAVWIAGEVHSTAREFLAGAVATIELSGGAAATSSATLKAGERSFLVRVPVEAAGDAIEVRARLAAEPASAQASDSARVELDRPAPEPLLFRRGPSTGNRVHPAADFRFSRTERLRLEFPIAAGTTPGAARFLDRNGQPLQLPVQVTERTDESGQRWLTADAVLAPLGPGDYVVEVTSTQGTTEQRVLTAVRVTR